MPAVLGSGPVRAAWVRVAAARLQAAGLPTGQPEAELLLAHVLGVDRLALWVEPRALLPPDARRRADGLLERRAAHEPLQYLLGELEFMGLTLAVGPGVFIPRPETEGLVARALAVAPPGGVVLEPCTGSGAIACALAVRRPDLRLWATEREPAALDWGRRNVARHGLAGRVALLAGDLLAPLEGRGLEGRAALIVANPPYLAGPTLPALPSEVRAWEPRAALDGGPDGLAVIDRLVESAPRWLAPGGTLLLEIGEDQGPRLRARLAGDARYDAVHVHADFTGRDRVLEARTRKAGPCRPGS